MFKVNKGHRASPMLPPISSNLKSSAYSSKGPVKSKIEPNTGGIRPGSSMKNPKRIGKLKSKKKVGSRRMTDFSDRS